jgi:hypothetical protein
VVQQLREQLQREVLGEIKPVIDQLRGQASRAIGSSDPEFAEQLTAAPRSYPAGYRLDRPVSPRVRHEAKVAELARQRGGVWSPHPDECQYKVCDHEVACPDCASEGRVDELGGSPLLPCATHHRGPAQCDRCWTPETAARHLYALGLGPRPRTPLTPPEARGSQRAREQTADEPDARAAFDQGA